MAPTPEQIKLDADLQLLISIKFEKMPLEQQLQLQKEMATIKDEYDNAKEMAARAEKGSKDEKYYNAVGEAIAKSVPAIVRGALSANAAFKKGDNIAGSAAIMDICASVIPALSAVLGATGPQGAIVGMLFSVAGQILAYFAPQPPSLVSQIDSLLARYSSDAELAKLKGVGYSIAKYSATLHRQSKDIRETLALPLVSEHDADAIYTRLHKINKALLMGQTNFAPPDFANWTAGGWLTISANQDKEGWPEVLGAWCRGYSDLVTANITLDCLVNPKQMAGMLTATSDSPAGTVKNDIRKQCLKLKGNVELCRENWQDSYKVALGILNETRPTALDRGLYVSIGNNACLYVATGRKGNLPWVYKSNTGYINKLSIIVPKEHVGSLTPKYKIFVNQNNNKLIYHTLDPADGSLSNGVWGVDGVQFADVSPILTPDGGKGTTVYTAHDGTSGFMESYSLDANNKWERVNWRPGTPQGMVHVRAVLHPSVTLLDDPDRDAMDDANAKPPGPPLLSQTAPILYGGFRNYQNIFVVAWGEYRYVPSPWPTYGGIEVDPYYLWVFGSGGFACATHASVIKCLQKGNSAQPRWIGYQFSPPLYPTANQRGLTSLSPCVDGTLTASIALDDRRLYTADYSINIKDKRIDIGSWSIRGGDVEQVQKMPIPCWSLYEQLKGNLQLSQA